MTALLLLSALLLVPAGGDDVVARAGDTVLTREAFADWLVARVGAHHVEDCLTEMLVLREAERAGVLPDEAEVARAFEDEKQTLIRDVFHGEEARYLMDLESRGVDPDGHAERRKQEMIPELALKTMARQMRDASEVQLRKRYADLYGKTGELIALDVLFFNAYGDNDADGDAMDPAALRKAAVQRGEAARAGLVAGTPLEEVAASSDPVRLEFVRDGVIEQYRARMLGVEVDRAVASLDRAGDLSPVIPVWDGCYIIRLRERTTVSFEEARDVLLEQARLSPVTAEELSLAREHLLQDIVLDIRLR